MKVAVCFSGGIRYPENGLFSLNKIKSKDHDIKVFAHTWQIQNEDSFLSSTHNVEDKTPDEIISKDLNFLNKYGFESLLVENYETKSKKFKNLFNALKFKSYSYQKVSPISMHYSIWKSNELKKQYEKENDIIFDIVIRIRYDSLIEDEFNLSDYIDGDIFIPFGGDWGGTTCGFGQAGINDQFAIGKSKIMDSYSNMFNCFADCLSSDYHAEMLFRSYLKKKNINPSRIPLIVEINNMKDFRKDYSIWDIKNYMHDYSPDYEPWWQDEYGRYEKIIDGRASKKYATISLQD